MLVKYIANNRIKNATMLFSVSQTEHSQRKVHFRLLHIIHMGYQPLSVIPRIICLLWLAIMGKNHLKVTPVRFQLCFSVHLREGSKIAPYPLNISFNQCNYKRIVEVSLYFQRYFLHEVQVSRAHCVQSWKKVIFHVF